MTKKIIAATLLFSGLLASSVPASASMNAFFFLQNGNSYHQSMNPNDFLAFLRAQENNTPTPNPEQNPTSLPPAIQQLMHDYQNLVKQPLDGLMRYYTRNFSINTLDEAGYHVYIFNDQSQLLDIAQRIRRLEDSALNIFEFLQPFINGSGTDFSLEKIENLIRLCSQVNVEINILNTTLQGLIAQKPTINDLFNGRCIDTFLRD